MIWLWIYLVSIILYAGVRLFFRFILKTRDALGLDKNDYNNLFNKISYPHVYGEDRCSYPEFDDYLIGSILVKRYIFYFICCM